MASRRLPTIAPSRGFQSAQPALRTTSVGRKACFPLPVLVRTSARVSELRLAPPERAWGQQQLRQATRVPAQVPAQEPPAGGISASPSPPIPPHPSSSPPRSPLKMPRPSPASSQIRLWPLQLVPGRRAIRGPQLSLQAPSQILSASPLQDSASRSQYRSNAPNS